MPSPVMEFLPHAYAPHKPTACRLTTQPATRHNPSMEENTKPYISHSQFTTWLQCGEKYRLTRIVGVEEDPAWYFSGGTAVHSAADAIDHALLTP